MNEARRLAVLIHAVESALLGIGDIELPHGARRADVAEPPLLLERREIRRRALMREQAILHAREKHHGKLQALGRVQRHHLHTIGIGVRLPLARLEHRVRQERLERLHVGLALGREAARRAHQLEQILHAALAALALLLFVVLDEPARLDHVIDLLVELEAADLLGELVHHQHERP